MSSELAVSGGLVRDDSGYGGEEGGFGGVAWLKFFSDKAKPETSAKCAAAGVKQNTFYYEDSLGILSLDPCRVFLLDMYEHKAVLDGDGRLDVAAPADADVAEGDGRKWCDRMIASVLVVHPAGLQPAMVTCVKAMCRPFQKAKRQIIGTVGNPEVVKARGPLWEPAANAVLPQGRFTLRIWGGQEPPKSNPKGPKFNAAYCEVLAPTAAEVAGFNAYAASSIRRQVAEAFARQVAEVQKKYEGGGE